jgi:hypothetical protein
MTFIPYDLMDSLLGANITARQAFELIVPVSVDAGLADVCEPLIEFLTIALVQPNAKRQTPPAAPRSPSKQRSGWGTTSLALLQSYSADKVSCTGIFRVYAPLCTPARVTQPCWTLLGVFGIFFVDASTDRTDRAVVREESRRPRTVRERMSEAITDRLLLLCQVSDDEDLPPLYHEWAARPRGVSERWVLQQAVEAACAALSEPSFEVTPTQVMAFKKFRFAGSAYFDIGTGLLPFNITPEDGISPQARTMLAPDRVRADAFDLGADPESGAVAPGDVIRLRNTSGYVPATWSKASDQLHCARGFMGAILGVGHPAITAYGRFWRIYTRMINRLESEIYQVHGRRLGPALVTFHVQLAWSNWLATQLETGETGWVDVPAFSQGLDMLEVQNNLMWLPTVTNMPILLALRTPARTPAPAPAARNPGRTAQPASGGGANAGRADAAAAAPRRDPGPQVRNTNRAAWFLANTLFSRNVRSRSVTAAISVAGPPSQRHSWWRLHVHVRFVAWKGNVC